MYFPVGNSLFCFPEGPYIKCFAIYLDFPLNNHVAKTNKRLLHSTRRQLRNGIPVGIHLNFDQGHVTKNQPIPVLVLLGESLGIKQYYSFWLPSKSQKECADHYLSQHVFNLVSQFASQGTYSNRPTVFVTAKHHRKGLKHDAASVWLEDVSAASFKICLRELQNFAGVHEEISVARLSYLTS